MEDEDLDSVISLERGSVAARRRRLSQCIPQREGGDDTRLLPPPVRVQPNTTRQQSHPGLQLSPAGSLSSVLADNQQVFGNNVPSKEGHEHVTNHPPMKHQTNQAASLARMPSSHSLRGRNRNVDWMAPLRREEESVQAEDILFGRCRTEHMEHSPDTSPPPSTPVETFHDASPRAQISEQPKATLRSRILAVTGALRARRVAGNLGGRQSKLSWRSKVLAIASLARRTKVSHSEGESPQARHPLQGEASLALSEASATPSEGITDSQGKLKRRRKKTASISQSVGANQKHAHLIKAFGKNNRDLLDIVARQDVEGTGRFPAMKSLKVLLSSEKTTKELMELSYEPRKLQHELKTLLQQQEKEEKKQQALEEADNKERRGQKLQQPQHRRFSSMQMDVEEAMRRKELGYQMPKETFERLIDAQDKMSANQMVVARLMQSLIDLNQDERSKKWNIPFLRWYTCLDPDSWFINIWTVVYMLLILEITTLGLYSVAFSEGDLGDSGGDGVVRRAGEDCAPSFSAFQWFDAGVDLFFIVDILFRMLLFGQIVESKAAIVGQRSQSTTEVVVDPQEVFGNYVRQSLLVDMFTAVPIQWISMALEAACHTEDSTALLLARTLRVVRITRVVKLFRTFKVRMWMRKLKRMSGNTSIMQMMHLVVGLAFLNHIWTCLSWLIQSLDDEGFESFKQEIGLKPTSTPVAQYSIMFMNTLQIIFAIEPYGGDTILEAWFGSFTLALSVFISATMLSKILEIWQMANETQTQRDLRINTVMQFTSRNGITTDLRNEVLDYFEFRYSNPAADFEKRFLDDLPTEMQTRVISQMFPGALEKSVLFTGVSEMFTSQLIVRIARRPVPTMPQQVIIAQGAFGSEMFLLKSGTVEVSTADETGQTKHVKTLGPGSTFGDLSLWMDSRHNATVTSLEFCQLHMLTRHDLEETLQSFPENVHVIAAQALAHCLRSPLCRALEGISMSAAERVGRRMAHNRREFEPGRALYVEGDDAEVAFVIQKGKVEVELLDGRLEGLDDVRCVGFEALMSSNPFQETVRAKETVVAYSICAEDIIELFARDRDLLEEREAVAEEHYRRVMHKNLALRWMLMSQELVARNNDMDDVREALYNSSTQDSIDGDIELSNQLNHFLHGHSSGEEPEAAGAPAGRTTARLYASQNS